ncbi:MAG: polysaccharide biosynthesis tyrosine autokinase [Alphaproteobacteria bacterium]|nr:polysaccharide biosynthesis tyrosine autokinase [Alphaproteobacteria bacterium]
MQSSGSEIDLREILRKLWRRRRIIIGTVTLLTALSVLVSFQLTPLYKATALVMLEPRESQVIEIDSVLSGLPPGLETMNSEIQVIKSRRLAGRVVDALKLDQDPEFNGALREKTILSLVVGWIRAQKRSLLPPDEEGVTTSSEKASPEEMARIRIVSNLLAVVSVLPKEQSRVIEVSVDSENAVKAARIANKLVDEYLVDQLEAKFEATKRANDWLQGRLTELRKGVVVTDRAVEEFRRQSGLVKGKDDVNLAAAQISELSSQLVIAGAKRAESEARLQQIEDLMKRGGAESAADVLQSRLIQALRQRESEVLGRAAELSVEYGPKHPRMIAVRTEINDLRAKIAAEVTKIVEGLRNEVDVALAREASLRKSLEQLEQRVGELNAKDVQLRALERESEANRTLMETFLARFKETSAQQDIQAPDARIISAADVPTEPDFPRKKLIIGAALILSTLLGVALVFLVEQLDAGFRSMEQIETLSGYPALGLIPQIKSKTDPIQYVLDEPSSAYAESLRNLQVGLTLSDVDRPPKIVLLTSSGAEEGKTTVSLSLARLLARSGKKVVIIDCDLRKPTVHTRLGLPRSPGLVELLAKKADAVDVIRRDEPSGASVITAGEHAASPPDLLGSEHMKQLVGELAKAYDMVILDSSPVLAVTDSRVLCRHADKTIFVIEWEKTRREAALHGFKQMREAGANLAGGVLTRVDVKRHAQYDFADSGYYHGRYEKYYTTS